MFDVRCSTFISFFVDQTGRFLGHRSAGGGTPETFKRIRQHRQQVIDAEQLRTYMNEASSIQRLAQ
jgi:hypothetical protein